MNTLSHLKGNIAVIEAHADDAAAMMSNAMATARRQDSKVYGVTATNGQWADKRRGIPDVVLGRYQEAQRGWADAGVPLHRQIHFGFEDGTLASPRNTVALGERLIALAVRYDIETLVTMGDLGVDNHPDHIAVHTAALFAKKWLHDHHPQPLVVLGLTEHNGDIILPTKCPEDKLRLLGRYASQFEIIDARRAPRHWSRYDNIAISPESLRELDAYYPRQLFDAEHYDVS